MKSFKEYCLSCETIPVVKNTGEIVRDNKTLAERMGALATGLLAGAMLIPNMSHGRERMQKPPTTTTQSALSASFSNILNLILKHEGLAPKQTPFRITNPEMRRWDKIHGFKIDKNSKKPTERQNFIYLENPADVPKAVKKQFVNYATNPEKYGLKSDVTLKDAIAKFDQSGASGKISYLLKNIPNLDLNQPLRNLIESFDLIG